MKAAATKTRLYSFSLPFYYVTSYLASYLKELAKQNTKTHQNKPSFLLKFKVSLLRCILSE
jgi:hypothetical protein